MSSKAIDNMIYILCNAFEWYAMEYPTSHLHFLALHTSVSWMFNGIPGESVLRLFCTMSILTVRLPLWFFV